MAEGSYQGSRGIYLYNDDTGVTYLVRRDDTLAAIPEAGLAPATDADLDKPEIPARLKMRYVLWEGVCDGKPVKKKLYCNRLSPAYAAVGSTAFNIDGSTEGATTGRVGEKKTFLRLTGAAGPPAP